MDRKVATIYQNLDWYSISTAFRREVKNRDNFQGLKWSNIKDGKLTAKEDEAMPRNKICVYLTSTYVIIIKG